MQKEVTICIPRRGINDDNLGKKHALHRLVSAAESEYVWLMDDDVVPAAKALTETLPAEKADLYILPLKMDGDDSLLSRLQRAEYAAIQEVTMRTARRGHAVMCSGANLIVQRDRWLESYADLHTEIPSGDDMFLLESFRRRGLRITAMDMPDYTATVHAERTLSQLLRQRMRWAGKAPHYTDKYILRYGTVVLTANLLQLLCPLIILIKFPVEYGLIKKRDPQVSFLVALLLEVVYPYYLLVCIIGGLLRHSAW
ncbi:MAG: glycosyltransferase [Paludibacteraceae bacterium]|nr:glycosyltransferase [Paludibacteraceae bacterium]